MARDQGSAATLPFCAVRGQDIQRVEIMSSPSHAVRDRYYADRASYLYGRSPFCTVGRA